MHKTTLISLIAICSIATLARGGVLSDAIDDGVYGIIHIMLRSEYPDEKAKCMVDDFRSNKVVDKFFSADLLFNNEKLKREIQPYVDFANYKCTVIQFFKGPFGLYAFIALGLLAFLIICWLIRCLCC